MSKKDAFTAMKQASAMYGGFFGNVAQEIGVDKALGLHANGGTKMGAGMVALLKEELGRKKLGLAALESAMAKVYPALGMAPKFEKKRGILKVKVARCPFYEGCLDAGLDHQTIEMMCTRLSAMEYDMIKKSYPEFAGCLSFRSAAEEPCVEECAVSKRKAR